MWCNEVLQIRPIFQERLRLAVDAICRVVSSRVRSAEFLGVPGIAGSQWEADRKYRLIVVAAIGDRPARPRGEQLHNCEAEADASGQQGFFALMDEPGEQPILQIRGYPRPIVPNFDDVNLPGFSGGFSAWVLLAVVGGRSPLSRRVLLLP